MDNCKIICGFSFSEFQSIGCWKDTWDRAIPLLEGKSSLLDEVDYKARTNAMMKCAKVAKDMGFKLFALQNGGQCFGGKDAEKTFMKYGVADSCKGTFDCRKTVWLAHSYEAIKT